MNLLNLALEFLNILAGASEQFRRGGLVALQDGNRILGDLSMLRYCLGKLALLAIGLGDGLADSVEGLFFSLTDGGVGFGRGGLELDDPVA